MERVNEGPPHWRANMLCNLLKSRKLIVKDLALHLDRRERNKKFNKTCDNLDPIAVQE